MTTLPLPSDVDIFDTARPGNLAFLSARVTYLGHRMRDDGYMIVLCQSESGERIERLYRRRYTDRTSYFWSRLEARFS